MHDWFYVSVGYGLTAAAILGYIASLRRRASQLRRTSEAFREDGGR